MRHGHVDYFAPGLTDFRQVSLTPEGRRQATASGEALAKVGFDAVFCSGLPRTRQTAELVMDRNAAASGAALQDIVEFEEIRGGSVVVDTREELAARLAFSFDEATEPEATFLPGGERFADAYARTVTGLDLLIGDFAWNRALLVAHEGINRIILAHFCGAGLAGVAHFEQDLACINVLDLDVVQTDDRLEIVRAIIKAVNLTAYDPVKGELTRTSLEHLFDIDFGGARPTQPNC
jgi:probable phosphoglycerate mutase